MTNGVGGRLGLPALAGGLVALVVGVAWWLTGDIQNEPVDVVAPSVVGVGEPSGDGPRAAAETPEAAPVARIDAPAVEPPAASPAAAPGEADAPLALSGRVVDPDDLPIAGATVAFHPGREIDGDPALEITTDADGRFTAELDTDAADVMLLVTADDFAPRPVALARAKWPERELELVLRWIVAVSGRVTDAETGRPLVGARVTCADAATTTDDAGRYRLDAIAVGIGHMLSASADGYVTANVPVHLSGRRDAEVDVQVERGAEVVVVIVDAESDRPLPGIEVRRNRGAEDFVTTDASGRHTLIATDGMRASLHLAGPDHATVEWSAELRDPLPASIRIPLPRWAWIDGRVVDTDGAPVEGAKLSLSHSFREAPAVTFAGPGTLRSPSSPSVESDGDGRFALPVTPTTDERLLRCAAPGLVAAPSGPFVLDTPGARLALDVTMERGGTIRGAVRMGGEAWTEGSVTWKSLGAEVSGRSRVTKQGTYELTEVLPGGVELTVRRADFDRTEPLTATLEVDAGEVHEHDFDWPALVAVPITGRVTFEDGAPAVGATVNAHSPQHGFVRGIAVDDDGVFTLDVEQGSVWRVSALLDGRNVSVDDVAAGTASLALVLPTLGRVRLELVDADDGTPVRSGGGIFGLSGVSWRASGSDDSFRRAGSSPDVDGVFELTLPLSTGAVDLVVAPDGGYEPRLLDALPLSPDDAPPAHRVELRRGLEVRLTAAEGTDRDLLEGHLVFLVSTAERDLVAGPFEEGDDRSNWRFNGQHIFLGRPYFADRVVTLRTKDICVISGLRPGRHEFVVMPDDVVFDPPAIDVTPEDLDHEVTWTRR